MMFCCCNNKDPDSSYSLAASKVTEKNSQPPVTDCHIQKGNGALSNSNQNLGPEASLDKSTITSIQREKEIVSKQPAQSSSLEIINKRKATDHPSQKSEPSSLNKQLGVEQIDLQISSVTEEKPVAKQVFISTVNVKNNSGTLKDNPSQLLASINSQLDKVEQAIAQVESKSAWEGQKSVPDFASQLKVLHTQVLEATSSGGTGRKMADKNLTDVVSRLESVATRLESLAARGGVAGGAGGSDDDPIFYEEFLNFLTENVDPYYETSNAIGGEVKAQAELVKEAFNALKDLMATAGKHKMPNPQILQHLLQPLSSSISKVQQYREMNRASKEFNHLSAVSEAIPALGWVTVSPKPAMYVKDMFESFQFYGNRVKNEAKDRPDHAKWAACWVKILKNLQDYIKDYHPTGLTWNPEGKEVSAGQTAAPPPPPPAGGAPPPPPPPPAGAPAPETDGGSDRSALFASINQGDTVTKGLRKVTDDMKTHKNPALRQGPAPFKAATAPKPKTGVPTPAPKPMSVAKPPKLELENQKKWIIEYFKDDKNITLKDAEMKHTVYIFKCEGSVINIKGKVNSITVDSCKKTGIVFEDVLSSVEFVNCQSVQAQVTGKVNTFSIDKTDGCQLYLSESSLDVDIVAAKSSEMNVLVPVGDGDFKEFALPEQFKTKYNKATKSMTTTATDSL